MRAALRGPLAAGAAVVFVAAALLAAIAQRAAAPRTVVRTLHVFGSLATLELVAPAADAGAALDAIERRLNARHREWHPWERSDLTELNAALARGDAHRTTPSILALIEAAGPLVAASGGRFDPGAGALVALWGFHTSDYPVTTAAPDEAAIARWRASPPGLGDLRVEAGRVASRRRDLRLDFNAIAEGMATREIVAILASHRIDAALVALGGDVHARGDRHGRPWRVAVQDPEGGALAGVALRDGESLYASGGYRRYRGRDGARLPHVIDPRTGRPARDALASAVLARDPVLADAAATALLVAGPGEWLEVAEALGVTCALLVATDGTVHATHALDARLAWSTKRRIVVHGSDRTDCSERLRSARSGADLPSDPAR